MKLRMDNEFVIYADMGTWCRICGTHSTFPGEWLSILLQRPCSIEEKIADASGLFHNSNVFCDLCVEDAIVDENKEVELHAKTTKQIELLLREIRSNSKMWLNGEWVDPSWVTEK